MRPRRRTMLSGVRRGRWVVLAVVGLLLASPTSTLRFTGATVLGRSAPVQVLAFSDDVLGVVALTGAKSERSEQRLRLLAVDATPGERPEVSPVADLLPCCEDRAGAALSSTVWSAAPRGPPLLLGATH